MENSTNPANIRWYSEKKKKATIQLATDSTLGLQPKPAETVFLYLDESGNFDFGEKGTSYFIMTCLAAKRPFTACHRMMDLKYDRLEQGCHLKKFHATTDVNQTRTEVYRIIEANIDSFDAYSIYVDKSALPDGMKSPGILYSKVIEWLLEEVFKDLITKDVGRIVVTTDSLPKDVEKKQVVKPLKRLLKSYQEKLGFSYHLEHHPSESDFNLQIADYVCWAFMRRKTERGDWPYSKIAGVFAETGELK